MRVYQSSFAGLHLCFFATGEKRADDGRFCFLTVSSSVSLGSTSAVHFCLWLPPANQTAPYLGFWNQLENTLDVLLCVWAPLHSQSSLPLHASRLSEEIFLHILLKQEHLRIFRTSVWSSNTDLKNKQINLQNILQSQTTWQGFQQPFNPIRTK